MGRIIPDTITEQEFLKMVKAVKKPKRRLAFMLGFYNCLRVSEVVNLKPENVDKGRKLLMVKQGKGGKDRHIPIAPEVINGLKHLPVGVAARALQVSIKKYAAAELDKDIHFHTLRHSGATHYHNVKGWDIRYIQVFLGHAKLDTTQIYVHVNPQNLMTKMWGLDAEGKP